ncbi:sugar nucleotide-binding protein [Exiguobacterium sp. s5]|uniref:SDR family oxidoreductase n=1 Tax=Exiguobacterium sp. s5 TaxID=2751239 RepID=UPI001BEBA880|nr:sugar nucleotide-binding protein [Exiguobacterium sp. s5]
MNILVLGGTGMAGHTISLYFKESGHNVAVLSRNKVDYCESIIGDVTNFAEIEKIIVKGEYDAVINAVGILNADAENNKSNAVLLNSYLPHFLSDLTKNTKTKIIHMSTDCVFSGKDGSYSENALKDGDTFYDRSKALGELDNNKDLTFRNSIIGPDMKRDGIGLFNWFMKQEGKVQGYTKAIWTGVTTLTLAKAMEKALDENLSGLYNLVNNDVINKYELLTLFNKYFKDNELTILPSDKLVLDKSLVNNREDFSFQVPSYEVMISEMREWIDTHQELYSHYFLIEE